MPKRTKKSKAPKMSVTHGDELITRAEQLFFAVSELIQKRAAEFAADDCTSPEINAEFMAQAIVFTAFGRFLRHDARVSVDWFNARVEDVISRIRSGRAS